MPSPLNNVFIIGPKVAILLIFRKTVNFSSHHTVEFKSFNKYTLKRILMETCFSVRICVTFPKEYFLLASSKDLCNFSKRIFLATLPLSCRTATTESFSLLVLKEKGTLQKMREHYKITTLHITHISASDQAQVRSTNIFILILASGHSYCVFLTILIQEIMMTILESDLDLLIGFRTGRWL